MKLASTWRKLLPPERSMVLVRILWVLLLIFTLARLVLPLTIPHPTISVLDGWTQEETTAAISRLGISPSATDAYNIVLGTVEGLIFVVVGLFLFLSKPKERMAVFVSFFLITFGLVTSPFTSELVKTFPVLGLPIQISDTFGLACLMVFFYLFPNARFVPRWTRWVALAAIVQTAAAGFIPALAPIGILAIAWIGGGLAALFYRYARVSTPLEKQEGKIVVFGMAVLALLGVGTYVMTVFILPTVFPVLELHTASSFAVQSIANLVIELAFLALPISIGIAVLRYGLYEIDVVINRTLVYVPLTAILAGIFAASISVTQKLFVAVTGQQSDAAAVITTLIVVAVLEPIKTSLQSLVDKRFKQVPDPTRRLQSYGGQLASVLEVVRVEKSTRKLLDEAVAAFDAQSGAIYLDKQGKLQVTQTSGDWKGDAALSIPMETAAGEYGCIALGARRYGLAYTLQDKELLKRIGDLVAQAIESGQGRKG